MRPIDPLMGEHRLIERMIGVMRRKSAYLREVSELDVVFVDAMVDFFRTYTDRTHHGKEEGILFRDLAGKPLSPEHRAMMDGLIEGHRWARRTVAELEAAKETYLQGKYLALNAVLDKTGDLIRFYPGHIRREDDVFFPASLGYMSQPQEDAMLAEFLDWDRRMIHEKYAAVVDALEHTLAAIPEPSRRAR